MSGGTDAVSLEVRSLRAGYGRSQVLFDVDLDIPEKGGLAVLGRNGAGKTTLLKALMGELPVKGGRVLFKGRDITAMAPERRVLHGLGCVPQEHAVFARLSVRDNLRMGMFARPANGGVERALDMFPKLAARLDQPAGSLSGGERKMLAIGRALVANPSLLLLDEPTEGVWIGVIDEIGDRLAALAKEIAVVLVEQHLELAWRVCERVCVLERGRVVLSAAADEVRAGDSLMQYLAP